MPGGWVQPRVIGHWYTSLSAITNHKCHWLNIIYIYIYIFTIVCIYKDTIVIYYIFYYILYTCSKIHGSTSKNVTNSYRFCGSIAIPLWVAANYSGRRGMQGLVNVLMFHITLKYWGYNLQQILVLVMWTKSPKWDMYQTLKLNGCTKSQNMCSLEVSIFEILANSFSRHNFESRHWRWRLQSSLKTTKLGIP